MVIKLKILGFFIAIFLIGCSGNSETETFSSSSDIKRFTGVVNNSSVQGAYIAVIPISTHGQFSFDDDGELEATIGASDEDGRFGFAVEIEEFGPYVLTATAPEFEEETELELSAKASCQLASGCLVDTEAISFGEYYSLEANQQWSAAIESISSGQFIVVNPITEMARVFGFSTYVNDSQDLVTSTGTIADANYYSTYGVVKGNSQTAALLGLGDILSIEPANLALLHTLDIASSTSIEESIRYGALLAAWQELELLYDADLMEGDFAFQYEVIYQYISNGGQLYQAAALDDQILSLKDLYQTALTNLIEVRDYHLNLSRSLPGEVNLAITRFETEIEQLTDGVLTTAEPVILEQYVEEYSDAVMKTKAMVNYVSNLKDNFVTEEYRDSIKASSDLISAEARRLSPSLDLVFQKILSIYQYYVTCTHGDCDIESEWHSDDGSAGNTFVESEDELTIVTSEGTNVVVTQGLVFDDYNPEGSTETNVHDLFISGVLVFGDIRLELSDLSSEESGIQSGARFSFEEPLEKLPLTPEKVVGGMGASIDESLVPDYIELVLSDFTLFDPLQEDTDNEIAVTGYLTALMLANTDADDFIEGKADTEKLGKRYNLSSVNTTLSIEGALKGEVAGSDDTVTELRDNAWLYLEATASEAYVSSDDAAAYFPDEVYPTFEAFFNPREGFSVGSISPEPLVVTRRGVMNFPVLDTDGNESETEVVEVQYIELDYEHSGLERYVVYPKLDGEDEYFAEICVAQSEDEDDLIDPEYTKVIQDEDGLDVIQELLTCFLLDKYEGEATPDGFVSEVYSINKDLFNLREFNGQGAYRINYPEISDGELGVLVEGASYYGTMEVPIVLGVDSLRMQFQPELVNSANTEYFPESLVDISLIWRTHDLIDVSAMLAFNPEQVVNNPDGSGLPYLAVGSGSESYSIAYSTDEDGNEYGEYALAWAGVTFVDGPVDGTQVMQATDDDELREGVFAELGSNVSYSSYTARDLEKLGVEDGSDISEEKCGFFARGDTTEAGEDCEAIAYFTFRGLVTGSLREERDGVYVIRYIDGSWQVLGGS
jgi:hypothetical protein